MHEQGPLLHTLALQLEETLDTGLLTLLEGPGGFVLSILQDPAGNLLCSRGRAILYILGALAGKGLRDQQDILKGEQE